MRTLRIVVLILAVGALQNLAGAFWSPLGFFDALSLVVVTLALRLPFEAAVLVGAAAGLTQDALGGGLLGLHAFSKTAAAAAVASLGGMVMIRGTLSESLLTGVIAFAAAAVESALLGFLDWPTRDALTTMVARGALTALLALVFLSMRPWVVMKWRQWRRRSSSPSW